MVVDTTPEYCHQSLAKSLSRLQTSYIDLYYIHRLDRVTPIEKTIHSMVELKEAGKIKHLGISECSADSLRRAHTIHPIAAVQMEYSPFCLSIESSDTRFLETARELGVAIVAYSPLAKGFLSGAILTREDFAKPGDSRSILPWFSEDNWPKNVAIVKRLADMAAEKGVTLAQFTLAWVLAQGDDVFAIPGTAKLSRLEENLGALPVSMSSEEEDTFRKVSQGIVGGRMQDLTGFTFVDTPLL
jgi:aryl-alcohol dehydrogenase-like predicted oxidoreductase